MTPRQEFFCRAQLNRPGKQCHVDIHLKEHPKKKEPENYESVRARCTRANNPLSSDASVIMLHITSSYERHVSSVGE